MDSLALDGFQSPSQRKMHSTIPNSRSFPTLTPGHSLGRRRNMSATLRSPQDSAVGMSAATTCREPLCEATTARLDFPPSLVDEDGV